MRITTPSVVASPVSRSTAQQGKSFSTCKRNSGKDAYR
jgi:hypothetical protein